MARWSDEAERLYELGRRAGREAERDAILAYIDSVSEIFHDPEPSEHTAGMAYALEGIHFEIKEGKHL